MPMPPSDTVLMLSSLGAPKGRHNNNINTIWLGAGLRLGGGLGLWVGLWLGLGGRLLVGPVGRLRRDRLGMMGMMIDQIDGLIDLLDW